jgi:hypothetical protein
MTYAFLVTVCMAQLWCFGMRSPGLYDSLDACFDDLARHLERFDDTVTLRNPYCFLSGDRRLIDEGTDQ